MGLAASFIGRAVCLEGALTHDAAADDEGGLAHNLLGSFNGCADLGNIVSVNLKHFPSHGAILGAGVFCHYIAGLGGELDFIGIIEHDEVIQLQFACNTGCTQ